MSQRYHLLDDEGAPMREYVEFTSMPTDEQRYGTMIVDCGEEAANATYKVANGVLIISGVNGTTHVMRPLTKPDGTQYLRMDIREGVYLEFLPVDFGARRTLDDLEL